MSHIDLAYFCFKPETQNNAVTEKAKQVVLKFLLDNEPSFVIDYTRNGNPKPESYDKADSIVIAKAGVICERKSLK